ncbi:two-component system, OmpR family, phosphate regulon sensor histidine kinase PhoR [Daejeonella rubra]|uniref:histidine kinase n=1 Tax=Daejeonella rubra TaxID=990371 RepID=A0A1G9USG8_9SPHI|nr:ATP-binding protein [Daejeonella rubra]SDM62836.1 two-component system, OmpR family, phosphate regulon sensor histidine kinase PhoR [Daejeonella rubra]
MISQDQKIKKLIKLNDELENYFRNTIIPQLFVDSDLILRKFTPPAMKQFSLKTGDVGKNIEDIKDNFRFHTIVENIEQVIDSNEILEKEIQTTDLRWYQMNIIPYVITKTKKTDGVIITFVEITARVKDLVNQEMLIADHETLLDTISHDIKGPLTSLLLTTNQLKKVSTDKSKAFLMLFRILESSIKKMQAIIMELTDAGKLKDKYKVEEELLDFENILEDVRLTLAGTIMESGAEISVNMNVSQILYSRRKLRSIVYNLVNNAIKFHSPDKTPEILITTKMENKYVVITIKDNGIGIDKTKHKEIFSKYSRVGNTVEGSGIGLYLVNEIVTNSGGKILLKSTLGKGSEFRVYLPAH